MLWLNYYYFVLLNCFPLSLHFLTSLINLGTQGRPGKLKLFYKQEAGDTVGWGGLSGPGKPLQGPAEFNFSIEFALFVC